MYGFVMQLQTFGESFERHPHIGCHLLRINAATSLVVQLGQDHLQSTGGTT